MAFSFAYRLYTFLLLVMFIHEGFSEPFQLVDTKAFEAKIESRSLYQTTIDQLPLPPNYCVAAEKILDISILYDTSLTTESWPNNFYNTIDFVLYLSRAFEMGASKTRIALLRFINHTYIVSNFTSGTSHLGLQQTLLTETPLASGYKLNTAEALAFAKQQLSTQPAGMTDREAKKVLIFITFTQIGSDFLFQAARDKIQTAGISVFVVAVGEAQNSRDQLKSLTSRPFSDYVEFQVSSEMAGNDALNTALIDAYDGCDQCLPNPCVHGTCSMPTQFECKCDVGYKGVICDDIDYCAKHNPCHSQPCSNPIDRIIICNCTTIGRYGEFCQFVDHCVAVPGICRNGGTCQTNRTIQVTKCMCAEGYYGDTCMHVDNCMVANPCLNRGICSHDRNTHVSSCTCIFPYTGNTCADCLCQNGGQCTLAIASGSCQCPVNCNGNVCETCSPYCVVNPTVCQNNGSCNNTGLTYQCLCTDNCSGQHCETCTAGTCDMPNIACPVGHICKQIQGGNSVCACPTGCSGVDCGQCSYCDSHPLACVNGGTCLDQPMGKFRCQCPQHCNGAQCETCVDPCVGYCRNAGTCTNQGGNLTCQCYDNCKGDRCDACQLPCDLNPGMCLNGGTCEQFPMPSPVGDFTCLCRDGCTGNRCEVCPQKCGMDTCQNGGTCIENVNGVNGVNCSCTALCYGDRCESCVEFCTMYPSTCKNGGTCQNMQGGSYFCSCTQGCYGTNCEDCPCLGYPCLNGGTCIGVQGAPPMCQCTDAYTGNSCEVAISDDSVNPCDPSPCLNGCYCIESCQHSGGYVCKGSSGYIGKNCEIEPPSLDCLPMSIEIRVPEDFARSKSRSGSNDMQVFVGTADSVSRSPMCSTSQPINGQYVITLYSPFSMCGKMQRRKIGLDETISSDIWVNLFPNDFTMDMPVPIATFECVYSGDYTFISSLRPVLTEFPTISEEVRFTPQVSLCKTSACPAACPTGLSIVREAVYTVGQIVYITLTTQPIGNTNMQSIMHSTLSRLVLSCGETRFFPGVELVTDGCMAPTENVNNLDFVLSQSGIGHVICLSFRAARLASCKSQFFIHADIQICQAKNKQPCPGSANVERCLRPTSRKRRAIPSSEQPIVIGPFYVFEKGSGIPRLNYTEDGDKDLQVVDKKDIPSEKDVMSLTPAVKYVLVALFIFVILAALVCAYFVLQRASVAKSYRFS
uniref:Fibropellin-1-like n=1 Tax=Phallusia mammillata TaxID=59560 RepID=A0A6F9DTG5_9ASCI|nr:fibropellin-1-like [Phallusia mammillata]